MTAVDYRSILRQMVVELLSGRSSVPEFQKAFYYYYVDDVPEDALSERDAEFFSLVHEKLDWTDREPNEESRQVGWIDFDEFIEWLRDKWREYERAESSSK